MEDFILKQKFLEHPVSSAYVMPGWYDPTVGLGPKKLLPVNRQLEIVMNAVCDLTGVTDEALKSKSRLHLITPARQLFHFIAWIDTSAGLAQIGKFTGGRDHTTVLHSIKTTKDKMTTDVDWRKTAQNAHLRVSNRVRGGMYKDRPTFDEVLKEIQLSKSYRNKPYTYSND